MADQPHPDDIATLRAELAAFRAAQEATTGALRAEIARLKRRRIPRRFLPVLLAALLVALVPLATLAANPFNDLNPNSVHNPNIDAIYTAGITTGCDPNISYCPNDKVTREEMASFLARTAGLGTNPPVANAKTAQTATNANALGGQPPSAYLSAAGDTTYRYPGSTALPTGTTGTLTANFSGGANITLAMNQSMTLVVPMPRATAEYGRFLAVKSLRVCYSAPAGTFIARTLLYINERAADETNLIVDETDRTSAAHACYDLAVTTPTAIAGMTYAYLYIANGPAGTHTLTLDSLALTLTPLAAGAAEVPGDGSGGQTKP